MKNFDEGRIVVFSWKIPTEVRNLKADFIEFPNMMVEC